MDSVTNLGSSTASAAPAATSGTGTGLGAGLQIGGALLKALSAFSSARAAGSQAQSGAAQIRTNSRLEIQKSRRNAANVLGAQRAITAGAGLAMSGSPLKVMLDTAKQAELEVELIRRGAMIQARDIKARGAMAAGQSYTSMAGSLAEAGLYAEKNKTILQDLWESVFGGGMNSGADASAVSDGMGY